MEPEGAAPERLEPEGAAPEGEEGAELRVVIYKLIVRVLRFVAKLDDGSEHQVAQHDVEFEVNMKRFTVEKMIELIGSRIVWGSGQEVHILCKDKHFESVERIDNYWKLLTSFLERWEEKELLVLAQVVDIAKGVTASSCSENIPSSEIVDNIICSSSDVYQSNASSASCVDDSTICNALRNNERYVQSDGEVVIDWSTLEITPIGDDIIAPMSQENMCEVLGIEDEVEDAQPVNDPAPVVVCHANEELMAEGAIPVDDQVPEDIEMSYDKDHPKVEKGSIFPTMIDCRRAVRQWAINEEFNLGTHRADKSRWMAHCTAEDCPWKITCRIMADKTKTRVNQIGPAHTCVSSSRLNSAMASQDWVQERSKKILRKTPNIGCKDLQEKLEEDWNVTTGYHTVWKGRERAKDEIYGSWGTSFRYLFNFKAEMELRSPGSIVEVDTKLKDGLSKRTTTDGLREAFAKSGEVVRASSVKNSRWYMINANRSGPLTVRKEYRKVLPSFIRPSASYSTQASEKRPKQERTDLTTVEDPFNAPTYNIPEKPVTFVEGASYSVVILAGLGVAALAGYAVSKELIFEPKEYKIFGKALARVQSDSQVTAKIGYPITGYGTESRNRAARQRIQNRVWTDEDGVEHVEVGFHIRGPHGAGKVFAEMFKDSSDRTWKFTFLLVEITSPRHAQIMLESYLPA